MIFCAVTQLWIKGDRYPSADQTSWCTSMVCRWYSSNSKIPKSAPEIAYDDNLTNYKQDIPRLFHYNAFCILTNALDTRVGSFNSDWEHFFVWLRPDDETEKIDREAIEEQGISIERALAGLFPHERLRDYIENFILFYNETEKSSPKIISSLV